MLTAALLAAILVSAQPEIQGPLSPASLPPPPEKVRGPLGSGICMSATTESIIGSLEGCRAIAMSALASEKGFCFAEMSGAAVVLGYTKTCRIAIYVTIANIDEPYLVVCAACRSELADPLYCQDVATSIARRVKSWAESVPKNRSRIGTRDLDLEKKLLPTDIHVETLPRTKLNKHYFRAALLLFEKRGFKSSYTREWNDGGLAHTWQTDKVPAAMRVFERRQYKDFVKGENLSVLAELERVGWQGEVKHLNVLLCFATKDNGMTAIYCSTSNARDHGKFPIEMREIAAAVRKSVFE